MREFYTDAWGTVQEVGQPPVPPPARVAKVKTEAQKARKARARARAANRPAPLAAQAPPCRLLPAPPVDPTKWIKRDKIEPAWRRKKRSRRDWEMRV